MNKHQSILLLCSLFLALAMTSCSKKIMPLAIKGVHVSPFFPESNVKVATTHIGFPAIPIADADVITKPCGSTKFTLAVPDCIDKSGYAEEFVGPIADQLITSLSETHRFELIGTNALTIMTAPDYEWEDEFEGHSKRNNTKIDTVGKGKGRWKRPLSNAKEAWAALERISDGLLDIYITSRVRSKTNPDSFFVSLQIQLIATQNIVKYKNIFSREYDIKVFYQEGVKGIKIDKKDLDMIANDFADSFPSTDINQGLKIIEKHENIITINVGANQLAIVGMRGFVVKESNIGPFNCRLGFIITQADKNSAYAELVVHNDLDKLISEQIEVGEPIKIK